MAGVLYLLVFHTIPAAVCSDLIPKVTPLESLTSNDVVASNSLPYILKSSEMKKWKSGRNRRQATRLNRPSLSLTMDSTTLQDEPVWNTKDEESLLNLLSHIVNTDLRNCLLTIAYGLEFEHSQVLKRLLVLPNQKQIAKISSPSDIQAFSRKDTKCRSYVLLQRQPDILLMASDIPNDHTWDYDGKYIIVGLTKSKLKEIFRTTSIHKTESVIGIVKSLDEGQWTLYTNWEIYGNGMSSIVTWKTKRFTYQLPTLFPKKVTNLQGAPLKVALFEYHPIIIYQRGDDGLVKERYGQEVMIVKALAEAHNATLVYEEVSKAEKWGKRYDNGSWNGLPGFMQRGDADIGICNLYILDRSGKLSIMQLSTPYTISISRVLIHKPKPLPKWERISYPFQLTTWLSVFAGLLISGPLLFALSKLGQQSGGEKHDLQTLGFAYLYSAGIHFMEGQYLVPTRRGIQIFIAFLWLYAMVITTGYNANLTALLTVSRRPKMINSFKDLYESGLPVFGSGPLYQLSFKDSGNPYLHGLAERYTSYYGRYQEMLEGLEKGEVAMIGNEASLLYMSEILFTHDDISIVRLMKEPYTSFSVAIAYQYGSPLTKHFNLAITRMVEGGLVSYWFKDSLRRLKKATEEKEAKENKNGKENIATELSEFEETGVQALTLDHMGGFFLILISGVVIGLIISAFEMLF